MRNDYNKSDYHKKCRISMECLKKIKKMKDSQISKQLAMSEMIKFKQSQLQNSSEASSFISKHEQSFLRRKKQQPDEVFTIKNLDENKVQLIDKEDKVNSILQDIDQLPEIERLLDKIWNQYLSQKQKEQEEFLEACYQGNIQRVKKVLKGKSKHPFDGRDAVTAEGKNAIHLATISGSYKRSEIISELVKENVDINGRTFLQKRTPLMLGCILGNEIAVRLLLDNKADINLTDYEGNTALHLSYIFSQQQAATVLLEYEPLQNIKNNKGLTAQSYLINRNAARAKTELNSSIGQEKSLLTQQLKEQKVKDNNYNNNTENNIQSKVTQNSNNLHKLSQNDTQAESNTYKDLSLVKKVTSDCGSMQGMYKERIKNIAIKDSQNMGLSSFNKISILGRGAFGQVYLVENSHNGQQYAMKALDKASIMQQNILRYCMTERKILSTINHPFVVKLHYAFQSETKLFLVMDYCPGGDMLKMIKKGTLKEDVVKKYAAEIVLAIEALHKAEIIYRDLKPGNVIFDKDGHACLTDFGLSKQAALSHSFCGSTAYLAPEMLWRRGHTKVLDWYLLGVLIYECLTGRPPFWDTNKQQLFSNIKSGRYKPLSHEFSKEVRDLIEKLLKSNSNKRLGAEGAQQIKKHAWFNEMNWKDVEAKKLQLPKLEDNKGKPLRNISSFQESEQSSNSIKGWNYSKDQ